MGDYFARSKKFQRLQQRKNGQCAKWCVHQEICDCCNGKWNRNTWEIYVPQKSTSKRWDFQNPIKNIRQDTPLFEEFIWLKQFDLKIQTEALYGILESGTIFPETLELTTNAIASKANFGDEFDAMYSILSMVLLALYEEECTRNVPVYENCDNIYHYKRMIRHYNILLDLHERSSTTWKQAMQFGEDLQETQYRECARLMQM